MSRRLDREIRNWSDASARTQLGLLWKDVEREGVKVISYWEETEWSSTYNISASESRAPLPGKRWALGFADFDRPGPVRYLLSDESEGVGREPVISDAREIRRIIELPGIEERPELSDLLIALGLRRDEMDIPFFLAFTGHEDRVVRYVTLGVLSWQPSIGNETIAARFGEDPDPLVADLAARFAAGRTRRKTRP